MKSSTIRIIVLLTFLAGIGILITQFLWVKYAYEIEEKEFDLKVKSALRTASHDIMKVKDVEIPHISPVEQKSEAYYIVITNTYVEADVLEHYLNAALIKENISTNYVMALYDCMSHTVEYQKYVVMPGNEADEQAHYNLPIYPQANYYFGIYFPHRTSYITSQSSFWLVSTIVLILIFLLLSYLLFIIFRERRLRDIQKDFINNMTHELKTPLSSIQLSAQVLKKDSITQNPQRLHNYANIIFNESTQLLNHVERVLQMAKTDKGQLELKKEWFVWQHLLKAVVERHEETLQQYQVSIKWDMPEEDVTYFGDSLHLGNVISNLIDNAIKYNERTPCIDIQLRQTNHTITINVKDNGIGIEKKHIKRLFGKFYRVPTGNIHNVKGFGLGLNYVKSIIKMHGGTVRCLSEIDKGSQFIITLKNMGSREKI